MIERNGLVSKIEDALRRSRVVILAGPRQSGKTTLARRFVAFDSVNYFDLEDLPSLARLEQPQTTLARLDGLVVIDEIQRMPELFPILRVLVDREQAPARFLLLGSASPALVRDTSESLAGRSELIQVPGFSLQEIGIEDTARHWLRGGFPRSFLADSEEDSLAWRKNYIQSFLERDLPQWGIRLPPVTLFRFWSMLAHYHGQIWNGAEMARALGISQVSVRRYLDILEGVFMLRVIQPWHANLDKRQVRSPKIIFRDTGLLHTLLGIRSEKELLVHPRLGASWEGYIIEEVIKAISPDEVYFWAAHTGAELDLFLLKNGLRIGVEVKRVDAPRLTPSMRTVKDALDLDKLVVLYPGSRRYPLAEGVEAAPVSCLVQEPDVFFNEAV